ncbi:hypothetical protein I7I50_00751 [Histoplasma capsulatum G186AR]|uniref:Uncharacterized protein n=1 Tax=Ajellomyces capsulatus TaxID=5037 RepID=A0A8H8CUZ7_AJECA|nr:hypothetical protein I7I52_08019 [Histoplasma capsulatum]QSS72797.1 hypothetical protein I7I50_00751 [Histoplasma capsulatum G186AR]
MTKAIPQFIKPQLFICNRVNIKKCAGTIGLTITLISNAKRKIPNLLMGNPMANSMSEQLHPQMPNLWELYIQEQERSEAAPPITL